MSVPFISNLGFTEVSTAGTLNTKAGSKDALPVQYYKLTADITGVLTINNTANHAKIILDMNNRNLVGAAGTGSATTPIIYNGDDTVEIKGGGLITSGGQINVSDSGNSAYNQTPSGGDGNVTVAINTSGFTLNFSQNYVGGGGAGSPFGGRGPNNTPAGQSWSSLTGTNGSNITGASFTAVSYAGIQGAATGNTISGSRRMSTTAGNSPRTAWFYYGSGVIKKRVSTTNANQVTEPTNSTRDWGFDDVNGSGGRITGVTVNSRLFTVTNNNTFDITFTSGTQSVTVTSGGGTATLRRYDATQAFSFTGSAPSVQPVEATGTGAQTVTAGSGGAGATGTVVIGISGTDFTVTNNNSVPINFVSGTGSATINATSTSTFTGSGTSWSYTGQNTENDGDGNPTATATAFGGTGVTNSGTGVPSSGIDTTNFTGKFNRTS